MAIRIDENKEGHFHGDKVKMTGRKDDTTYSITIYEFVFLEGRSQGETFWQAITQPILL